MRNKSLKPIEIRQDSLDARYIDLGPFYNFALSEEIHGKPENTISLPTGIHDYKGVKFETRGVIQLASAVSLANSHLEYPKEIRGIPINQKAESLSFLHSSAWASPRGTDVVSIVVSYANGDKETIVIQNQIDVEDWWFHPENSVIPPKSKLAWEGSNKRVEDIGMSLKIFHFTWHNPKPDVKITSIDLISSMSDTGYMLYGLTCL